MMLDDLSTGDLADWQATGPGGENWADRLSVVPKGSDGGPCLRLEVRLKEKHRVRLTRALRVALPKRVRFRYRCEGQVDVGQLRICVKMRAGMRGKGSDRAAQLAVRDFLPETSGACNLGNWIEAQADMDRPLLWLLQGLFGECPFCMGER